MNDFLDNLETVLYSMAEKVTPDGSEPKAVVHQWAHAIAYKTHLFEDDNNIQKKIIIKLLKNKGLYKNREQFRKEINKGINLKAINNPSFSFIDLFAGIGGFRLALQKQKGQCVFSSEWDKSAQNTYYENYGEYPFGDITSFITDDISDEKLNAMIPDHEILAAGFPCQPFSHAGVSARNAVGKKHGFKCNTQGTLFFDIMRITSVKKPKVLFLENVRNIERHDGGLTFSVIKDSVEEVGYDFKYAIIDSSPLVPQRRVRCYMVCFRKDLNVDFKFPIIQGKGIPLKTILEKNPDKKYTISDKLWKGHINRTKRNLERGTGFTAFTANLEKPSNTIVARYGKDGKECLVPQKNDNPRFLTPRECARLQGYPEKFIIPSAKTPAYKQFGNSVAVPVIEKIAKNIIKELL
ncbi:MAG: DNA (cytosine-5-)-methyltransferase [Methylococcales bacterium]